MKTLLKTVAAGLALALLAGTLALGPAGSLASEPVAAASAAPTPGLKVAFIGDQGNNANSIAVLNLIKNEGAHMVIHSGDFDYGDNPDAWDANINNVLGASFPYFASVGNHDVLRWSGYQQKLTERLARVPGAVCTGDLGVKSSCHFQGLHFILSGVGALGTGHETYLRDTLAADDSVWSICSWHKNQQAMQVGGKTNEVGWGAYEECRQGGAIIATAHEHSYSRTRTLSDTDTQTVDGTCAGYTDLCVRAGSTFVFVSGIGGQSIRDQLRCLPYTFPYGCNLEWASIYTNDQGATYGALFCTFNVDGQPDLAACYLKAINGQVVDSFTARSFMGSGTPPPPTVVHVHDVDHWRQGKDAWVKVWIHDAGEAPEPGASVTAQTCKAGSTCRTFAGTTGADGSVSWKWAKGGAGTYTTTVTSVALAGATWDQAAGHAGSGNAETETI